MRASAAKSLLPFILLTAAALSSQQQRNFDSSDRTKLIALENAWNQAQLNHDAEALTSLVADDFVYTDYDGTVMDKAGFLADLKDPAFRATLIANENVRVHMYSSTAVVFGTYHTKGTYKGKPFDHYGRFTDTWIYLAKGWQCVSSHTNLLRK
jgi:ketosteroid isomerase-like protein